MPKLVTDNNQSDSKTNMEIYATIVGLMRKMVEQQNEATRKNSVSTVNDVASWFQEKKDK